MDVRGPRADSRILTLVARTVKQCFVPAFYILAESSSVPFLAAVNGFHGARIFRKSTVLKNGAK